MTATLKIFDGPVIKDWIDYNGHMNDACYVVVFARALDNFIDHIGLDADFRAEHQVSLYTLQSVVHYLREVKEGESLQIFAQLLEHDSKKLRLMLRMHHGDTGTELALLETLLLHMDMSATRPAAFLPVTRDRIERLHARQAEIPWPDQAGRGIALRKPG
ncbi:thioesterase family protein [Marinobacterium rhizophilum]|uniref:Thioesterase family protein n=1 Tax=Marinobacterium rhizophilum TaxID=420402 RepID=A0ABY5HPI0_9GAMM|nr:thioesterase family protein [Marinobacterium rhizophilum]UTW13129.1 thioesterase family protein [Marinobacterium rhizophilum]